jgi:hypothetical protein
MGDFFSSVVAAVRKELEKKEMQERILQPLMQWFFRHIIPYVVAIMLVNFFLTIGAVSLVLYVKNNVYG